MGNILSDFCLHQEARESNENLRREFQQKSVNFPTCVRTKRGQSISAASEGTSSQITECLSSEYTITAKKKFDLYSQSNSMNVLQYSPSQSGESAYGISGKYSPHLHSSFSFPVEQDTAESMESSMLRYYTKLNDTTLIREESLSKKSISVGSTAAMERVRSNAIELTTVDPPSDKIFKDTQLYVHNIDKEWEAVSIVSWNAWNGTWQVKGTDSECFPAAPSALKSKEQYEFLSRERIVYPRSFSSFSEATSIMIVE